VNRRAFLRTGAASTAIVLAIPAWGAPDKPSPPSDSELLSQARNSIERHRKTDIRVKVQRPSGEPFPNATVKLEQVEHEFLFGCNLFGFNRCADPEQEQAYRTRFAALFNYCTLGFYWASYEFERGKPAYDYTDRVLEWTDKQGIHSKGHPLVWDHAAGSPRWLPDDPAELAPLVRERVKNIVSHYKGRIDFWDVVNEATHLPDEVNKTKMAAWGAALGSVPYTGEPLKTARAANPNATLLVNDYRTDPPYLRLLSSLRQDQGFLMNAVGIQSHMHQGVWPLHKVYSICETYGKLGLPVHFTETTILSGGRETQNKEWGPSTTEGEAAQAEHAVNFYTMLFSHPAVAAITWWDFSDYNAWLRAPAGLLRQDMSPKPIYERLQDLVRHQWWTNTQARTDEKGACSFRGCPGLYHLSAEAGGKRSANENLLVGRARPNDIILRL
jgi:GH35 family endo-1,4-beta-xylanase